jgi:probable F420-dependent oxidoreductase
MNIGVVYPQTEYGSDPVAIRDFAQTAENLGYTHIVAYDHVLGANPDRPGGWSGPYTYESTFMEIFVLFTYMAAVTQKIGFVTGILILPQRQTALVAKQAATLDVLSSGRLRLGVGLGWNTVEYQSLGQDFHTRGRRMEEQVTLLRQLWTQPLVQFSGRWDTVPDAGIKPLPVQRPIPIWMGGSDERVLRRAARLADGWMPNYRTVADALPALQKVDQYLAESGRSREKFGLEARLPYGQGDLQALHGAVEAWRQAGATHLTINTLGSGFHTPGEHLAALERFAPLAKA